MTDPVIYLYCKACDRRVSHALHMHDEHICLQMEDGVELIPPGTLITIEYATKMGMDWQGISNCFITTKPSLLKLRDRLNWSGCCGPDGGNGPNLECDCGSAIATEYGDCWMPHFVTIQKDVVLVKSHTRKVSV